MNVPNVNPTVSAPPAAPRPAAPKPIGPVMTERKVQAARKSIVTVDARLYGVKPQALSKYMNDMIKSSPFNGIIYNKTMFTIAKNNESHLKQISAITDKNHRALLGFNADFMAAHEETIKHLESLKAEYKKPNATTHKIEELINGEEEDRRRAIYAKREKQPGENGTDNTEIIKELTIENANLEKILKEGEQQAKDAKKSSAGGLLGFIKNPIGFIWDMLGSIPGGRLIGGLAAAAGIGAIIMHILPNTMKALYNMIVPEPLQRFLEDIKTMASSFKDNPLKFIGDRLAASVKFLSDMLKTQFVDPVIYHIKMGMASIRAFVDHPIDFAARDKELNELTKGLIEPTSVSFDVGKAMNDILVKGTYSSEEIKTIQKPQDVSEKMVSILNTHMTDKSKELMNSDYAKKYWGNADFGNTSVQTNDFPSAPSSKEPFNIKLNDTSVHMQGLKPNVYKNFMGMAQEYNEKTGKNILVTSAFRTYDEQAALAEKYKNQPGRVAAPGHSLHETGLAIDIDPQNANELDKLGLLDNYKFNRPLINSRVPEPWHIQPISTASTGQDSPYKGDPMPARSLSPEVKSLQILKSEMENSTQIGIDNANKKYNDALAMQKASIDGLNKVIAAVNNIKTTNMPVINLGAIAN